MTDIPSTDGISLTKEEGDEDAENADKRNPQHIKDKTIEGDNEFEEGKSGNRDVHSSKEEPMDVDSKPITSATAPGTGGDA